MTDRQWTLTIHGGSGRIERGTLSLEADAGARDGLARALDAGGAVLAAGGAAVDAVQAAIEVLEDDPHFNAGRGAALSGEGRIELDAAIMDGHTRAAGSVAQVTRPRHPIALARAVMDEGTHVLLAGAGADAFAEARGIGLAADGWFETPERRRQLEELLARGDDAFDVDMKYGTVGAVARDASGQVAAATSTGGVTGKRWGRIGDSPLIGAGTWADGACAVSATGAGEYFIRTGAGQAIAVRVALLGESIGDAADAVLGEIVALGGTGGVIVMSPAGDTAWRFSTPGMYRATASADGARRVAIYGDE